MNNQTDVIRGSAATDCSPALCSQCGRDCGRKRLCRLRLAHKYISFLIEKELEKLETMSNATSTRQAARKSRKTAE